MKKSESTSVWVSVRQLISSAKKYTPALICAITGILMTRAAELAIYKYVVPFTLDDGLIAKAPEFLRYMPYVIVGTFMAIGTGEFLSKYFMGFVGRGIVRDYRQNMLQHLLKVPMSYYKTHTAGTLLSKINYEAEQVSIAISDSIRESLSGFIAIVGSIVVMITISWQVTLVILLVGPVVALSLSIIGKNMRRYAARVQSTMGQMTDVAAEVINSYQVIKVYQGTDYELSRIRTATENNRIQELKTFMMSALSSPIMQFIGGVVLVGFLFLVTHDSIDLPPGKIFGLIGVLIALIRPMKQMSVMNNVLQRGISAIKSIQELLSTPPEVNNGTKRVIVRPSKLEFQNVSFAYPDEPDKKVLSDISFSVGLGETVAIVGGSGSGKSTLANLIARFYDLDAGKILLDGQDISEIELINLREQLALMTQHVILFNDTVANNIAYSTRDANQSQIAQAANIANAAEFIDKLPNGYDTRIGENGCLLSGGQRQRLAIARAVLKDAPILIMDEATSALDNESELAIKSALDQVVQDRITLIIAHRLSTIEHADKIIVMDQGRIVEVGTHRELLEKKGRYAQLQQV